MGKIALGAAVLAAALVLLLGLAGKAGAILPGGENPGYVSRLFDGSRVHRVDIQVEDWEAFWRPHRRRSTSPPCLLYTSPSPRDA